MRTNTCIAGLFVALAGIVGGASQAAFAGDANSPTERARRDRELLRAQVEKLPQKLIAEANTKAKSFDGNTWLDSRTFSRIMYFVPMPKDPPHGLHTVIPDPKPAVSPYEPPNPPVGAVERRWQDRYVLAQQYSYRYSYGGITKLLRKEDMDKPFEATFEIKIKATVRGGMVSEVLPVPDTPEGMVPWEDKRPRWRFFGSGGGEMELWSPRMPGDPNASPSTDLERKALAAMKAAPAKVVEGTMVCRIFYDAAKAKWAWRGIDHKDWPDPNEINWSMGLPKDKKGVIYAPREKTTQPASAPTTQQADQ